MNTRFNGPATKSKRIFKVFMIEIDPPEWRMFIFTVDILLTCQGNGQGNISNQSN